MRLATISLGLGLGFLTTSLVYADDWPQWRGPNRDGVCKETELLSTWPAGGPPLAWKVKDLGAGYSGVSVAKGRIYTMGDRSDAGFVHALNEADGKLLWSAKMGKTGGGGGYPGPRCTPTVAGDVVVALNQFGDLVCLDGEKGQEKWRKNLPGDFGGEMMSGWGYAESPLVDEGKVICTPGGAGGTMAALDLKTGAVLWRSKEWQDKAAYSSPIVAEIDGVRQYIQLTDAHVAGVAAADGKLLWRAPRKGTVAVIPTPIYHDHHVYVTSGYGAGCNLFRINSQNGQFSAEQVYANKVMVNHHGGVVLVDGNAYGYSDGKGWTSQNFKSGEALWAEKKLGKGSILYADGKLYLRDEGTKGTVALVEASPKTYRELSRFDQPERSNKNSWPHPVIANGKLYLRDQDLLLCYQIKK